ncbi:hypothetical protein L873DRAFT_39949 [Choiromyces venosus 120613-1]|uniref:DUF6973 domain-containing protein n=1 Tax=Choiromyces venosus 120613-1 TaxID=1336337 RepID=A0A3N4K6B3_9PEZI|nr:hypothetical protein L873DRAFT_39949 [Choiromyces venosus 120613-1]
MKFISNISLILIAAVSSATALPVPADDLSNVFTGSWSSNSAQYRYCMMTTRWEGCFMAREHSYIARTATLHNGKGDAFVQCYWNARMTVEMGEDLAKRFADLHVGGGDGPAAEKEMDLANGAFGREIGEEAKSSGGGGEHVGVSMRGL